MLIHFWKGLFFIEMGFLRQKKCKSWPTVERLLYHILAFLADLEEWMK